MHWYVDFHDPVPSADALPTVFEWAGGYPTLLRLTRIFYEKYVPNDDLLAPLFATMNVDHPQRVAAWLGEVFGGPPAYSGTYGGYGRMLSQHIGKGIDEAHRRRWVELLMASANDAGLPNDPEFRSVFGAYIEWGSRLAVENSTPGATPPPRMPMPSWDWQTAAGPPGSRISALDHEPESEPQALWYLSTAIPSVTPNTSSLCSATAIADRCCSPSTSGPTTTSAPTPTRSSNGSTPQRCPATAVAPEPDRALRALDRSGIPTVTSGTTQHRHDCCRYTVNDRTPASPAVGLVTGPEAAQGARAAPAPDPRQHKPTERANLVGTSDEPVCRRETRPEKRAYISTISPARP